MKSSIIIKGVKIFAKHGVLDFEKEKEQLFVFNAEICLDFLEAAKDDDIFKTVSYADIVEDMNTFVPTHSYNLIETLAYNLAMYILKKYKEITKITLEVFKPNAPIDYSFENVSTKVELEYHDSFISLGSNLGDKEDSINKAIDYLVSEDETTLIKKSSMYKTAPYGGVADQEFCNAAIQIKTTYSPYQLLHKLNEIESKLGRTREVHWGNRTIDMDIIFYDRDIVSSESLNIPHIDFQNRDFVLNPLNEIAPYFVCPKFNKTISQLLNELK